MSVRVRSIALALSVGVGLGSAAHGATITFQEGASPAAGYTTGGVTIRADQPTTNQNGSAQIIVGQNLTLGTLRGLLEFDLTPIANDLAATPGGVLSIDAASLVLRIDAGGAGPAATFTASLLGANADFNETTVTWNSAPNTAGGTVGTTLSVSNSVDPVAGAPGTAVTFGDTAAFRSAVQSAVAGPDRTIRIILTGPGEGDTAVQNFIRFSADESTAVARRPALSVTYSVPEPATAGLLTVGAAGLLARRRRQA